jgi:hypothetical protein
MIPYFVLTTNDYTKRKADDRFVNTNDSYSHILKILAFLS